MAMIVSYEDGYLITDGLQGSSVCTEAIDAAQEIAKRREEPVVLVDDDGTWVVYPSGRCKWLSDEVYQGTTWDTDS